MTQQDPIETWHRALEAKDTRLLDALLADDCVFVSPVVHTPQIGKKITKAYLTAAFFVFGNPSFRYVRQIRGERDAMLEFELELDGIAINGVDLLHWNDAGQVTEFKVMIRPLKAINLIHQKMGAALQAGNPA
jgi:hypothetical protein